MVTEAVTNIRTIRRGAAETYSLDTTKELLQDVKDEKWENTATPTKISPRKNLDLQMGSQQTILNISKLLSPRDS